MSGSNSVLWSFDGSPSSISTATNYLHFGGQPNGGVGTEANAQTISELAVTTSHMAVMNISNFGTNSMVFRKNTTTGSQSIASAAAGTWTVDATHTDSISAGDNYDALAASTSLWGFSILQLMFNATLPASQFLTSLTAIGTTAVYYPLSGHSGGSVTSETSSVQCLVRAAGTWSGLVGVVTASSNTATITSRKNTNAGNQSVACTASGPVVDATHSDSLASGDVANYRGILNSGSATPFLVGSSYAGSSSKQDAIGEAGGSFGNNKTYFLPFGGNSLTAQTANEARYAATLPYAVTASNLRISVTADTISAASSMTTRVTASGPGNQSVSIGSLATGVFEDATHTDSYASSAVIDGAITTGATGTGLSVGYVAISIDDGSNAGHSTETSTAVLAFAGISFASAATASHGAQGSMGFSGVAFAASVTDSRGARGALSFQGVSFAGAAAAERVAHGALSFAGVSFTSLAVSEHLTSGALAFKGVSFAATASTTSFAHGSMAFSGVSFASTAAVSISAHVSEMFIADLVVESGDAQISEMFVASLVDGLAHGANVTELQVSTLAYLTPESSQRCDIWKITRTDSLVFAFTSLDRDIEWGGQLYKTCGSLMDSASESSSELGSVGTVTLTGLIDHEDITEADLYAGLFDDATIEAWVISWGDPADPNTPFRTASGNAGRVTRGQNTWTVEVTGDGQKLRQAALVKFFQPGCRWDFGVNDGLNSFCPVNVEALALHGLTVTKGVQRYAVYFDAEAPGGSTIWNGGEVRWTYGANAGITCQVDTVDFSGPALSLWDLAPYPPQPGDTFDLLPGCPKDKPSCVIYGAYVSFGGFPDVPGPDALQQQADALYSG